jgi:hypothetical protein
MIIHEPEIRLVNGEALLSARIETDHQAGSLPERLWFAYPECYAQYVSHRADAFLAALAQVAQVLGEDLHLKGEVSPHLLYGMQAYLEMFHYWQPSIFKQIDITAERTSQAPAPLVKDQFVSTFSGGVDSFFTLYQQFFPDHNLPSWPLTHGLFIHGCPDIALAYSEKFQVLAGRYTRLYDELGLTLVTARTNLMQFSAYRIPIVSFLEAPLASCALGLSHLFSGLIIPAGETYRRYRLTTSGPLTPHHFATETFEVISSGGVYVRLQKLDAIAGWQPARQNLRVCFNFAAKERAGNCSRCSKCMRTRMDLHLLGRLSSMETFERTFTWRDYLRWGRWLEIGHEWEKDIWRYCWEKRPGLLPAVLVGILIGFVRHYLKMASPRRVKAGIFRFTAESDPHKLHEAVHRPSANARQTEQEPS